MTDILSMTSPLITISNAPINRIKDPRITKLHEIILYFTDWHRFCLQTEDPSSKIDNLLTKHSIADLTSCVHGLIHLCNERVTNTKTVTPRLINTDVVEIFFFCQQRPIYSRAIQILMPPNIGNHFSTTIGMFDKQGTVGRYRRASTT